MASIGVSIAIPQPWGDHLQGVRRDVGDPMADQIPPHVTLMPPTEVADETRPAFEAHLAQVAAGHDPFVMTLSGAGTFRPVSPVVFAQVSRGIASCEQLEAAVRSGPVPRLLEFHYHPHVTVAHHVSDDRLDEAFDRLAGFVATFEVGEFYLYENGDDGVWRPVRAFALGG